MGCASSKSTPVIESNGNEDHVKGIMMNNEDTSDENMIQKGKDMMHNLKNDISDMASDLSHKVGSYIHSSNTSKPSTPETERIKMPESDEVNENIHDDEVNETAETDNDESSESVPMRIISIDVDEGNQEQLEENQVPVKVSLSIGDSEDYTAGGEKPPTPMPEEPSTTVNAQYQNFDHLDSINSDSEQITTDSLHLKLVDKNINSDSNENISNSDSEESYDNNYQPPVEDVYDSLEDKFYYISGSENNENTLETKTNKRKGILSLSNFSENEATLDRSINNDQTYLESRDHFSSSDFDHKNKTNNQRKSVMVPCILNLDVVDQPKLSSSNDLNKMVNVRASLELKGINGNFFQMQSR